MRDLIAGLLVVALLGPVADSVWAAVQDVLTRRRRAAQQRSDDAIARILAGSAGPTRWRARLTSEPESDQERDRR